MNHRALIGQYLATQNSHLRKRRWRFLEPPFGTPYGSPRHRFPLIRIVLGCATLAAAAWFVCNIVVVGP